jgi:hypothetical protein
MKKVLLTIATLLTLKSYCQIPADTLSKYSYLIFAPIGSDSVTVGTCFFAYINRHYFLVTAAHVFGFWDPYKHGEILPNPPDTLYVRLYEKGTGDVILGRYSSSNAKVHINRDYFYQSPDLFIASVNLQDDVQINTVPGFRLEYNYNPNSVLFYGYAGPLQSGDAWERKSWTGDSAALTSDLNDPIRFIDDSTGKILIDTINYEIKTVDGDDKHGFSGAPVFWDVGESQVIFGGMIIASDRTKTYLIVVRPEKVLYGIGKFLSRGTE